MTDKDIVQSNKKVDRDDPFAPFFFDDEKFTYDTFKAQFEQYGFVWLKNNTKKSSLKDDGMKELMFEFISSYKSECEKHWTVENLGDLTSEAEKDISSPSSLLENYKDLVDGKKSFYVSTVINRNHDESSVDNDDNKGNALDYIQNKMLSGEKVPKIIQNDLFIPGGAWIFIGHVSGDDESSKSSDSVNNISDEPKAKKQKCDPSADQKINNNSEMKKKTSSIIGRAEHVDEVTHSGTFHMQLSGNKTWYIRPHSLFFPFYISSNQTQVEEEEEHHENIEDTQDENNEIMEKITNQVKASKYGCLSSSSSKKKKTSTVKKWRLKIDVEEGDIFVLNTKIWYHYTELSSNPRQQEWSVSVARDFYIPLRCPRDIETEGELIFENEQDIPTDLPRSSDPNCVLVEASMVDEADDGKGENKSKDGKAADMEDSENDDEMMIVLMSTKAIKKGEFLSVPFDSSLEDDNDDDEGDSDGIDCMILGDQEYNAEEMIDPRAISKRQYKKGDIIIANMNAENNDDFGDIMEELPCSKDPNCELVFLSDDVIQLKAISDIQPGDVLCTEPDKDMEYEEAEVDLSTGKLERS